MSEPKFTKGPWKAGKNPCMTTVLDGHEGKAIYPEGDSHHIAWANALTDDGDLDMDTALANAALIAAAPEMYVMLEQLVEAVKTLNAISLIKIKDKLIEDAVNIIKKARGEE